MKTREGRLVVFAINGVSKTDTGWWQGSLNVLGQPAEGLAVSLSHHHRAHEELDRSSCDLAAVLTGGSVQAKGRSHLVLAHSAARVNLVAQHEERNALELLDLQQGVELSPGLLETARVGSIDEEHDAVHLWEVILPHSSRLQMATEVESGESHRADGQLLRGWVKRRLQSGQSIVLEHVEQGCLAGVVKAEEEQLGVLVPQAKRGEDVLDWAGSVSTRQRRSEGRSTEGRRTPVEDPHLFVCLLVCLRVLFCSVPRTKGLEYSGRPAALGGPPDWSRDVGLQCMLS